MSIRRTITYHCGLTTNDAEIQDEHSETCKKCQEFHKIPPATASKSVGMDEDKEICNKCGEYNYECKCKGFCNNSTHVWQENFDVGGHFCLNCGEILINEPKDDYEYTIHVMQNYSEDEARRKINARLSPKSVDVWKLANLIKMKCNLNRITPFELATAIKEAIEKGEIAP